MTEKRAQIRRKTDRLIRETMNVHRIILDLLQGRKGDFAKALRQMQVVGSSLGRRAEDRKLGEALSQGVEGIARRLLELGIIDQLPRKVRLRKVLGVSGSKFPVGLERVGWEMDVPKAGERYCLYMDDGRLFRTGEVTEQSNDHFRTGNSVYEIEEVAEKGAERQPQKAETPPGEGGASDGESKGG
jgi:hypothetical protein